jgi:hypothetical protein
VESKQNLRIWPELMDSESTNCELVWPDSSVFNDFF